VKERIEETEIGIAEKEREIWVLTTVGTL